MLCGYVMYTLCGNASDFCMSLASKKIGHKTYHLTLLGVRSKTAVRIFGVSVFYLFKEQTWMMKQLHMGC